MSLCPSHAIRFLVSKLRNCAPSERSFEDLGGYPYHPKRFRWVPTHLWSPLARELRYLPSVLPNSYTLAHYAQPPGLSHRQVQRQNIMINIQIKGFGVFSAALEMSCLYFSFSSRLLCGLIFNLLYHDYTRRPGLISTIPDYCPRNSVHLFSMKNAPFITVHR
jgi:hypothetical protein